MRIITMKFSFNHLSQLLWILAALFIGWTLSQLPLDAVGTRLSTLGWQQWLTWIGVNLLIISIANLRWWLLIRMLKQPVGFGWLMGVKQAGQAVSFITPGPQCGGEPLQIFWLYQRGLALHKALLSLGLDRLYELIINLLALLIALSVLYFSSTSLPLTISFDANTLTSFSGVMPGLLAITLGIITVVWILLRKPHLAGNRLQQLVQRWQRHPYLCQLKNHQQALREDWRLSIRHEKLTFFGAAVLSLLGWVALLGELALLLKLVGVAISLQEFTLILVALRLAILLPIPAGIGTLEAAIYWSFSHLNLPLDAAISLIALMRIRDLLVLLSGLACWKWIQHSRQTSHMPHQTQPAD